MQQRWNEEFFSRLKERLAHDSLSLHDLRLDLEAQKQSKLPLESFTRALKLRLLGFSENEIMRFARGLQADQGFVDVAAFFRKLESQPAACSVSKRAGF